MLSCKDTVQVLSSNKELTFRQKIELKAHLLICKHCSSYARQLRAIADQMKKAYKTLTGTSTERVRALEENVIKSFKQSDGSGKN